MGDLRQKQCIFFFFNALPFLFVKRERIDKTAVDGWSMVNPVFSVYEKGDR